MIDLDSTEIYDAIEMAWVTPIFSREEVDAAGDILINTASSPYALEHAYTVIGNWKAAHSFPLNTFHIRLRIRANSIDSKSLTAQRMKRISSIAQKLARFKKLKLSDMQDIGGCRAVVGSVDSVMKLVADYKDSDIKHALIDEDNYIISPKKSGYRSYHLIYRYFSDRNEKYNGLKVEVQLRSNLQHAWATAVETVGTFIRQSLKSNRGEKEWLRFFALMGTAIAETEGTPPVPNTPTDPNELKSEIRYFVDKLDVINRLEAFGGALQTLESPTIPGAHFYLLELDPAAQNTKITGFKLKELDLALQQNLALEKTIPSTSGRDTVLVSAESIAALKKAFPNYFLDTKMFIELLKQTIV